VVARAANAKAGCARVHPNAPGDEHEVSSRQPPEVGPVTAGIETEPYLDLRGGRELAAFPIAERPSVLEDPPFRNADRVKTASGQWNTLGPPLPERPQRDRTHKAVSNMGTDHRAWPSWNTCLHSPESTLDARSNMTVTDLQIPGYIAGTWIIDPVHSHVGFIVKHVMVSKVRGRFAGFSGEIITAEEPLKSQVTVTIDASSIDTNNDTRDGHIRSADFLDVETHPSLTFASSSIRSEGGELRIDGDLTIRGVTKPVTLKAELPEFGSGQKEGTFKAGFSATTEINRTDFGVNYNGSIPGGGFSVGEKVQIVLEIEADLVPPH
jgi:polyisoprenoid-binding protein YceI